MTSNTVLLSNDQQLQSIQDLQCRALAMAKFKKLGLQQFSYSKGK